MSLISKEPEINNINWPIYLLANYENSGVLLDRCSSSFNSFDSTTAQKNDEEFRGEKNPTNCFITHKNDQLTTSGYLTGEESSNNNSVGDIQQTTTGSHQQHQEGCKSSSKSDTASRRKSKKQVKRCKLLWWQLIESNSQQERKQVSQLGAPTCTSDSWLADDHKLKQQLLHLCFNLHKAVSPFLIVSPFNGNVGGSSGGSWRSKGNSRSLQQQPIERSVDGATIATTHQSISRHHRPPLEGSPGTQSVVTGEDLSPAYIRRLSWRRKVLEKGEKRFVDDGREESGKMNPQVASLQRRLASISQVHSLDNNNSSNHNKDANKDSQQNNDNISSEESSGKKMERTNLEKLIQSNYDLDQLKRNFSTSKWSKLSAKRGKYGESLIHILIINHSNEHLILLICLLHLYPLLASDIFESNKFKGVSSLHLSIAYSNERLLKYLIDINNNNNVEASKFCVSGSLFRSPIKSLSWATSLPSPSSSSSNASSFAPPLFASDSPLITNKQQRRRQKNLQHQQQQQLANYMREKTKLAWLSKLIRRSDKVSTAGDNLTIANGKIAVGHGHAYWCDQMDHWPTANGNAHLILFDRALAKSPENVQMLSDENGGSCGDSRLPIYLGDTPLAWTISFGARTMYEILVNQYNFNQNCQDAEGNTCLHLLVMNNQIGWARFLVKSGADINLVNNGNLTPLLFACHLGRFELFNELLELSAVEFWSYSMIKCCGYPLTSLDSILITNNSGDNDESKDKRSAMSVILESRESDNEQKSLLLSSAVVKKLLEEKWRIFARRLFYHELLLSLAHLTLMTLSISLRPIQHTPNAVQQMVFLSRNSSSKIVEVKEAGVLEVNRNILEELLSQFNQIILLQDRQQIIRHLSELTTVLLSSVQLVRFADEWRRYGNVALQWTYNPLLPNFVAANILIMACALVRIIGVFNYIITGENLINSGRIEDILLIFAAPLLWSSLLFFIAAFRVTGPFVAMIRYMVVRDLRQFSLIYLVFLYSFAQCIFFVNFKPQRQETITFLNTTTSSTMTTTYSTLLNQNTTTGDAKHWLFELAASYSELYMDLFKMTLGVYDLQPYRHSTLARLFFLLFIYLIPILFNMLIAMMNNTYSLIISQSERAWSFQWARTLFALERRLSEKEKSAYLRLYSINIPAPGQQASTGSADLNSDKSIQVSSKAEAETEQENEKEAEQSNKRFVPALMIIKRMSYTRAERRRLIVGYWQRSMRSIISQAHKEVQSQSGEQAKKF